MKAIRTKYKGPTNTRGSRIIASDEDGNRTTISYPYELSGEAVHLKAAVALCDKMGWSKGWKNANLVGGSVKNGYIFVFANIAEMRNALEIAEVTIKRLDHKGSAQGTLDIITQSLAA